MKNTNFQKTSLLAVIPLLFVCFAFSPALVGAQDQSALDGLDNTAGKTDLQDANLPTMVGKIVGLALSFVGVIFLVLMIAGGIMWMVSNGNEEKVGKAKNLIIAAIIGLIVVLAAYALTVTIGNVLT